MENKEYGVVSQEIISSGAARRKAVVLTADKFGDMEVYVPVFRLAEEGWEVDIAAPQKGKITGESNWYYIIANKTIDEISRACFSLRSK